jgi:hypothetical protein
MSRRRILIEDEILLGYDCASHVEAAGFEVAGPYSMLKDVPQDLLGISGAILDVNIRGMLSYRLIDRLLEMNIPVILYTGYAKGHGPPEYANLPRVTKPTPSLEAVQELVRQLESRSGFVASSPDHNFERNQNA